MDEGEPLPTTPPSPPAPTAPGCAGSGDGVGAMPMTEPSSSYSSLPPVPSSSTSGGQGLTLVHLSGQLEHTLWNTLGDFGENIGST